MKSWGWMFIALVMLLVGCLEGEPLPNRLSMPVISTVPSDVSNLDNGSQVQVSLGSSAGATIFYSTDGSAPSQPYTGPFTVSASGPEAETVVVRAVARQTGFLDSYWASRSMHFQAAPVQGTLQGYVYIAADTQVTSAQMPSWQPFGDEARIQVISQSMPPQGYEPLAGATISVDAKVAYSDGNGFFQVQGVPAGGQWVSVDHMAMREQVSDFVHIYSHQPTTWNYRAPVGWFMTIGIEDYAFVDDLPGAVDDALAMEAAFTSGSLAGYQLTLTNSAADKASILSSLDRAVTDADANDYLVVYFSGRVAGSGFYDDAFWRDNIMPHDGRDYGSGWEQTVILDGELESLLRHFPGHVTLILDASHSGSFADGQSYQGQGLGSLAFRRPGYSVLASSQPAQLAHGSPQTEGMSVFTYFVVQGLTESVAGRRLADANNDGKISAAELHNYVQAEMNALFSGSGVSQDAFLWSGQTVVLRYSR